MKIKTFVISFICIFILVFSSIFLPRMIINILEHQISVTWPEFNVKIGGLDFGLRSVKFNNVDIKLKQGRFFVTAIRADMDLNSWGKRKISGITFIDPSLELTVDKEFLRLVEEYRGPSGDENENPDPWSLDRLRIKNGKIRLKYKDLFLNGKMSVNIDIPNMSINDIELDVDEIRQEKLSVKDLSVNAKKGENSFLTASEIKYDKNLLTSVKGKVILDDKSLNIKDVTADLWEGNVYGEMGAVWDDGIQYNIDLNINGIDLAAVGKGYEMTDKVDVSGKLLGKFRLKGHGNDLDDLYGEFFMADPGGILNIIDKRYIEMIAKYTGQSPEILMESFKNYNYSKGRINLFRESSDIRLNLNLDGDNGKRELQVVLHDFI
jgi:hypothetical protein